MNLWVLRLLFLISLGTILLLGSRGQSRDESASDRLSKECAGDAAFACVEAFLSRRLEKEGAEEALKTLSELEKTNTLVKQNCHGLAHKLGQAGFQHYGEIGKALEHGRFDCSSGYYHGAIERGLQDVSETAPVVASACNGIGGGDGAFLFHWCNHGLGHGLTAYYQYDIERALGDCNLLSTEWRRDSCWGGVFMENIDAKFAHSMGFVQQGRLQDDGSDFWPCLTVDEQYRPACFRIITARVIPKHQRDYKYVASACDRLATAEYRRWCFESYGRDAGGEGLHAELSQVHELCQYVPVDMKDTCYREVAKTVAAHFADPERARGICNEAGASERACHEGRQMIGQSIVQGGR